jgi:thiopurine S-methyltransferase
MEADFWHNMWNNNKIGFHLSDTNKYLVNNYKALQLQKNDRIFLPLCGKTHDIKWLLDLGHKIVGVELSEVAIKDLFDSLDIHPTISVHDRFIHYHAKNIDIYVGDFFNLTKELLGNIDAVYDRAAIVALPELMRKEYAKHLKEITNNQKQIVITLIYDQSKKNGPPFCVDDKNLFFLYEDSYVIKQLECGKDVGFLPLEVSEKVWLLSPKNRMI